MGKRTAIVAVLVFLALAVGLAGYVWSQQGSEPSEEARQETGSTTAVAAEETRGSPVAGTEGATTVAGTEGATVEQTDVIDEANLAEATPQEVLALYYRYQNEQALEQAYGLLSSQSQQVVSFEQFVGRWQEMPSYAIEEYSIYPVEVQDDVVTLRAELTVAVGGLTLPGGSTRQMVREEGGWRVVLSEEEVAAYTGS